MPYAVDIFLGSGTELVSFRAEKRGCPFYALSCVSLGMPLRSGNVTEPLRSESLKFDFSLPWAVAFVALLFVHNELHEIAHTVVGRLICGAWGPRNFNSWRLACRKTPEIVLAPLAGLVFS